MDFKEPHYLFYSKDNDMVQIYRLLLGGDSTAKNHYFNPLWDSVRR